MKLIGLSQFYVNKKGEIISSVNVFNAVRTPFTESVIDMMRSFSMDGYNDTVKYRLNDDSIKFIYKSATK